MRSGSPTGEENNFLALSFPHKQSVDVFVRHVKDCPHQFRGRDFRKCACPKYLYIYKDGAASRVSAKTGSWAQAEKKAQEVRDSWISRTRRVETPPCGKGDGALRG